MLGSDDGDSACCVPDPPAGAHADYLTPAAASGVTAVEPCHPQRAVLRLGAGAPGGSRGCVRGSGAGEKRRQLREARAGLLREKLVHSVLGGGKLRHYHLAAVSGHGVPSPYTAAPKSYPYPDPSCSSLVQRLHLH
ncbi:hypothetical protein ACP4OV_007203 [Aristida adscensionis]